MAINLHLNRHQAQTERHHWCLCPFLQEISTPPLAPQTGSSTRRWLWICVCSFVKFVCRPHSVPGPVSKIDESVRYTRILMPTADMCECGGQGSAAVFKITPPGLLIGVDWKISPLLQWPIVPWGRMVWGSTARPQTYSQWPLARAAAATAAVVVPREVHRSQVRVLLAWALVISSAFSLSLSLANSRESSQIWAAISVDGNRGNMYRLTERERRDIRSLNNKLLFA